MLNGTDLKMLKNRLPDDWVAKVQAKVSFGATKIRETLRDTKKYESSIIYAAIEVAEEFEKQKEKTALEQKQRIKNLTVV